MRLGFPLIPDQASTIAGQVDALYYFLVAVALFFTALIFSLVIYFAIKYRRRPDGPPSQPVFEDLRLELLWTVVPLVIMMVSFTWGARLYFTMARPPADALEITVVGKQWMWKIQHPTGQREINEFHVPVGRPIKLTMASEDVIHSFFVPAFRTKMDVVPGRYTTTWFEATTPGEFHLFCAEYCGAKHSAMIGRVVVMEPMRYQQWLSGGAVTEPPEVAGERLYLQLGCNACHRPDLKALAPPLEGLFGKPEKLQTGETVIVDDAYLRESILNPAAKLVAGYQPIMPPYVGRISEEGVMQIIAYIKSLQPVEQAEAK
jgi:cytochrome c oxidase subunit II